MLQFLSNLSHYIPELIVIATMCGCLFIQAGYDPEDNDPKMVFYAALTGLLAALVYSFKQMSFDATTIFSGAATIDSFSSASKMIMILATMGLLLLGYTSKEIYQRLKAEYVVMIIGVLVGGMLLSSANNLLTFYLGIETLSILSYVLSALKKDDQESSEAGLKYALYGGVSAGVMLFGMSHIYGVLGSLDFGEIHQAMTGLSGTQESILIISFLLFFVGIGFKIACVPFHMWSPDVYEGSPTPVTAFFALVPKVAGIVALARVTQVFFPSTDANTVSIAWYGLLHVVAALTMTVGNVAAIGQDSVKRLLAYSSISHAGTILMGVVVANNAGNSSVIFYSLTYVFMTLVAFYVTSYVQDHFGSDSHINFKGLIKQKPFMAIAMSIALVSLAGVPPFIGFVAKFNIFSVVVQKKLWGLAIIAGINSVIGLYYYMRLVKVMTVDEPSVENEDVKTFNFGRQFYIVSLTLPIVVLGIFWNIPMKLAKMSKIFIP